MQHQWLLDAIETADERKLMSIQRIIKFEKTEGLAYTTDEAAMNELRLKWKQRMESLKSEESIDALTAK